MNNYSKEVSSSRSDEVSSQIDMVSSDELVCSLESEMEFMASEGTSTAILLEREQSIREREILLRGNSAWESWADSVIYNGFDFCSTCRTSSEDAYPPNKKRPWLGIGEDEHCRDCGAFAVRHPHEYRDISRRHVSRLVADIAAVESVYVSPIFMTKAQTEKNRDYLSRLLSAAMKKDLSHEPRRYEMRIFRRHRETLFDYLIDLATKVYGDKEKAMEVYGDVSRDFDDIYLFIDEVKRKIQTLP